MKLITKFVTVLALVTGLSFNALAATDTASPAKAAEKEVKASEAMSDGEVKKVDKASGKITIKHGPLINLEMPAMTMVFTVKNAALLDQVKIGDKISFVAEKIGGKITVTHVMVKK